MHRRHSLAPDTHATGIRAAMDEQPKVTDLDWPQLFGSDPNLDGLISMQGASQSPVRMTQVRSSPQLCSADRASVQASATQNKPRFLRSADVRQESEHDAGRRSSSYMT